DAWQNLSAQASKAGNDWLSAWGVPNPKNAEPKTLGEFAPFLFQPNFMGQLAEQAFEQSSGFLEGLGAYLKSDYKRPEPNYKVLWQRGAAKLYDLAPDREDALAVFCVPSLINKHYVLDLYPEASFAQYLKAQGFRPLILDWGAPGKDETSF